MADVNYTKPTGDIKVFIDKFNIELDKAIKEINSAQSNLKNIYSDAIKVSTPRSSTWPKDDSVKTIGDLFKYTFPDISTNTFIEPPDYIISNSVDSAKMEDYNSWQKDLTGTELNKMFFKSIKNGLRANEKLNGFNQFKKPGITNPSLYSPGQYWFDVFMHKALTSYGPIFSSNSYIKRYADEKGLSASISIFSTSGDKETNKLNYSDFSTYILPLGKNIGDINVDIESTTSDGFFSGLRTQYKSGLISVLEKDSTFDFERGEEGSLTGEFIGNYEQMFLYKAFIQAGDNYKPVVLPYSDVKSEPPVPGIASSEPIQPIKKPETEYTFNIEKKDTFIVVGGTVSPPLELIIVPNDGTQYLFEQQYTDDLDKEYIEIESQADEEYQLAIRAAYALSGGTDGLDISPSTKERVEKDKSKYGNPTNGKINNPSSEQDFWTLVAICSREDGDPQAWCDVAQSIYNRVGSGAYSGNNISTVVTRTWQYEPCWRFPRYSGTDGQVNSEWFKCVDIKSASEASGKTISQLKEVAKALKDKSLQQKSKDFIQGRTDFLGVGQAASSMTKNGSKIQRTPRNNQFGYSFNYKKEVCYNVPNVIQTINIA